MKKLQRSKNKIILSTFEKSRAKLFYFLVFLLASFSLLFSKDFGSTFSQKVDKN
jgi:hypothetical protein